MLERAVVLGIVTVVVMSVFASILPRITPSLIALGVLVLVGRAVWFYTRRW
jgi:hypothetical protein